MSQAYPSEEILIQKIIQLTSVSKEEIFASRPDVQPHQSNQHDSYNEELFEMLHHSQISMMSRGMSLS